MSPSNLRQIESAFSTHRDEYAKFETAVTAPSGGCSNPTLSPVMPIIIAEDVSSGKSVQLFDDSDLEPKGMYAVSTLGLLVQIHCLTFV